MNPAPRVGLGVCIGHNGKVLLGKRKGSHGEGTWSFPGGHLEFGETWEECAKREVMEEVGITIKNVRFATATNDIFEQEQKHYITLYMLAEYDTGDVRVMEPEKCDAWEWFDWAEGSLPSPLFIPIQNLLKQGYSPFSIHN